MRFIRNKISPALILGFIGSGDIIILEMQENEFVFESVEQIETEFELNVFIFDYREHGYVNFVFNNCSVTEYRAKKFSHEYKAKAGNIISGTASDFRMSLKHITEVSRMLLNGIERDGEKSEVIEWLSGYLNIYPFGKDTEFPEDYTGQILKCINSNQTINAYRRYRDIMSKVELAFSLSNNDQYRQSLECGFDIVTREGLKRMELVEHGIFSKPFSRIYIGNEFCHNLFPTRPVFGRLLEKAFDQGLNVTVMYSYMVDNSVNEIKEMLSYADNLCKANDTTIELCINDWGVMEIIKENCTRITPVLGRLLNKRKKDSRIDYMWGGQKYKDKFAENNLNTEFFKKFLNDMGIYRFEFESHKMLNKIPEGRHSLHFPFYQQNTSVYCPLFAECTNFNRIKQELVMKCPQYCTEFYFKYPGHIHIMGRGNTIMGIEGSLLSDFRILEQYVKDGVDRLVFTAI